MAEEVTAGVSGILDIDNLIEVKPKSLRPDDELAADVRGLIEAATRLEDAEIKVVVDDGVVTLRGDIEHFSAKRAAERAAVNTLGVDRVSNKLKIAWDEAKSDDPVIESSVKAALGRNPYVSRHDIIVRCRHAHVDLFGLVDSQFEKDIADWTAETQKGVVHVNNRLSVLREWEPRSDDEIQEAINEKLEWTFFDRASEIDVNVENGVAILRGTVDTRRQWQRVMDIAVKAGARSPHNLLRIRLRPQRGRNPLYVPMRFDSTTRSR